MRLDNRLDRKGDMRLGRMLGRRSSLGQGQGSRWSNCQEAGGS